MPLVVDLFCGAGGMSWGLEQSGFTTVLGIDNNPIALKTFARNHRHAAVICGDIMAIAPGEVLNRLGLQPGELDCLVGGPPCQGFSKNVPRSNRFLQDPRNLLVHRFLEYVDAIRPKTVVMENVAEIVNAFDGAFTAEILTRLREWGYDASAQIFDAADLGIPQHRRRAFFFASRCGSIRFPETTHSRDGQQPHVTVWNAIGDLPSLRHGEGQTPDVYRTEPFSPYQARMRQGAKTLHNHVARPLKATQYARLASLEPGQGAKDLPPSLRPKGGYSGAYGRLTKDMVARTLTRWLFHPGSGRFGHPVDIRTITIREAARLHSFSDDFIFEGSFNDASSQIGNAVPPLILRAFAPMILAALASAPVEAPHGG